MSFKFISQFGPVSDLLNAGVAALQYLPAEQKASLEKALRVFEKCGVPTLWAPGDVDNNGVLGLTASEKEEAICRFIRRYNCTDQDWANIDHYAEQVHAERIPHIKVEYDPLYTGGDYAGTGQFVLIPLSVIEASKAETSADDVVGLAFRKHTKQDSMHIIHYTMDEVYNQAGELIDSPAEVANEHEAAQVG